MKRMTFLLTLFALLLLAGSVLAMESDNYQLDWFTPLTSSGGGDAGSANYAVNFTVGQAAIGASSGANYGNCLGYWCTEGDGGLVGHTVYLPLVLRDP